MPLYMILPIAVTWITLNQHSISIDTVWHTEQLTYTLTPAWAEDDNVIWSSSNINVATVSTTWLVRRVWTWTATITVTTVDWWFTDTCTCSCLDERSFFYDFRWWSLAGFQAAWWSNIEYVWSYSITWEWLQQTSGNNDQWEVAWVNIPSIASAKSIQIQSLWYYVVNSWSNNKRTIITDLNNWSNANNNRLYWQMAMNTSSPWSYNAYWIWWFGADKVREYINWAGWDTTQTLTINLQTWAVIYTNTWANTKTYTYTLSSSELAAVKTWRWVGFQKERWYSSYNNEALRTVWVTIQL